MNISKPFSRFVPETYDAVWSIALALKGAEETWRNEYKQNKTVKRKKLETFDYTSKNLTKDFLDQFSRLKFQGISVNTTIFNYRQSINSFNLLISMQTKNREMFHSTEQTESGSQHFIKYNLPSFNLLLYITLRLNF